MTKENSNFSDTSKEKETSQTNSECSSPFVKNSCDISATNNDRNQREWYNKNKKYIDSCNRNAINAIEELVNKTLAEAKHDK